MEARDPVRWYSLTMNLGVVGGELMIEDGFLFQQEVAERLHQILPFKYVDAVVLQKVRDPSPGHGVVAARFRDRLRRQIVADLLDGDDVGGVVSMQSGALADALEDIAASVVMDMLGLTEWAEGYYCIPSCEHNSSRS